MSPEADDTHTHTPLAPSLPGDEQIHTLSPPTLILPFSPTAGPLSAPPVPALVDSQLIQPTPRGPQRPRERSFFPSSVPTAHYQYRSTIGPTAAPVEVKVEPQRSSFDSGLQLDLPELVKVEKGADESGPRDGEPYHDGTYFDDEEEGSLSLDIKPKRRRLDHDDRFDAALDAAAAEDGIISGIGTDNMITSATFDFRTSLDRSSSSSERPSTAPAHMVSSLALAFEHDPPPPVLPTPTRINTMPFLPFFYSPHRTQTRTSSMALPIAQQSSLPHFVVNPINNPLPPPIQTISRPVYSGNAANVQTLSSHYPGFDIHSAPDSVERMILPHLTGWASSSSIGTMTSASTSTLPQATTQGRPYRPRPNRPRSSQTSGSPFDTRPPIAMSSTFGPDEFTSPSSATAPAPETPDGSSTSYTSHAPSPSKGRLPREAKVKIAEAILVKGIEAVGCAAELEDLTAATGLTKRQIQSQLVKKRANLRQQLMRLASQIE